MISKSDYNEEPVFYCSDCLSLRIIKVDGMMFCDNCNSTDIQVSDIASWEDKYKHKYKSKYLNRFCYGRKETKTYL